MEPSRRVPAKSPGVAQTLHLQIHVKKNKQQKNSARGSWEAFILMLICPGSGAQGCLRSLGGMTVVWCSPGPVSFPPWTTCGQDPPHPCVYSPHENSTGGSWRALILMVICPGSGAQGCSRSLGGMTVVWCSPGPVSFPPWTTSGQDSTTSSCASWYLRIAAEAGNSNC